MFRIDFVYWVCGALLLACALRDLRLRRYAFAAFWAIVGTSLLGGDRVLSALDSGDALPAQLVGVGVIVLALLAGSGTLRREKEKREMGSDSVNFSGTSSGRSFRSKLTESDPISQTESDPFYNSFSYALFVPALAIPLGTVALILLAPYLHVGDVALLDSKQPTLTALCLACVCATIAALAVTRAPPAAAIAEGGRLLDTLSWAALLPMLLAMLGTVFAATGVGDAVAHVVAALIPTESRFMCLIAYAIGMALFTMIMGNAFAAFPVMTAGVGLPLLIVQHHADPAALGALGMLGGYCGTLLTPMAANYNVVPVALLQLRDPYAVIRAQFPTAVVLFAVNFLLLEFCAFRPEEPNVNE